MLRARERAELEGILMFDEEDTAEGEMNHLLGCGIMIVAALSIALLVWLGSLLF